MPDEEMRALNLPAFMALLQPFSGNPEGVSVTNFFEDLESTSGLSGWGEKEKKLVVQLKSTGEAKQFVRHTLSQDPSVSFATLKKLMIERFKVSDPLPVQMGRFTSCRQLPGESVRQFAARLEGLGSKFFSVAQGDSEGALAVTDKTLYSQFLVGMNDKIKRHVLTHNPQSYAEAKQRAILEEENEAFMASSTRRVSFAETTMQPGVEETSEPGVDPNIRELTLTVGKLMQTVTASIQTVQGEVKDLASQLKELSVRNERSPSRDARRSDRRSSPSPSDRRRNTRSANPSTDRTHLQCFHCGRSGHFARECWGRQPPGGSRRYQGEPSHRRTPRENHHGNRSQSNRNGSRPGNTYNSRNLN